MKLKLNKTQKIIAAFAIITAIAFLVWGCNGAASNEVKADSVKADTTHIDSVKVDTVGKK